MATYHRDLRQEFERACISPIFHAVVLLDFSNRYSKSYMQTDWRNLLTQKTKQIVGQFYADKSLAPREWFDLLYNWHPNSEPLLNNSLLEVSLWSGGLAEPPGTQLMLMNPYHKMFVQTRYYYKFYNATREYRF